MTKGVRENQKRTPERDKKSHLNLKKCDSDLKKFHQDQEKCCLNHKKAFQYFKKLPDRDLSKKSPPTSKNRRIIKATLDKSQNLYFSYQTPLFRLPIVD